MTKGAAEGRGDEAVGSSPTACGTLNLCTGLGAQWSRVTENYFATGEQSGFTALDLGRLHDNVVQESCQLCAIAAL